MAYLYTKNSVQRRTLKMKVFWASLLAFWLGTVPALAAGFVSVQDAVHLDRTLTVNADGSINVNPVPSATTFVPAQVVLSTSATLVLASGTFASRNVCNVDSSIVEYIGPSGVTSSTGMKLVPGACWDMSHTTAAIYAVAASATPTMTGVQY